MTALDACSARFGRGTVVLGAAGFAPRRDWSTKFEDALAALNDAAR